MYTRICINVTVGLTSDDLFRQQAAQICWLQQERETETCNLTTFLQPERRRRISNSARLLWQPLSLFTPASHI